MGLGLAATYIQQHARHGVDVPSEEFSEVLRAQKALAFFNAWVYCMRVILKFRSRLAGGFRQRWDTSLQCRQDRVVP
jgi:hypothetical protein